jgi:hypothetical protein
MPDANSIVGSGDSLVAVFEERNGLNREGIPAKSSQLLTQFEISDSERVIC